MSDSDHTQDEGDRHRVLVAEYVLGLLDQPNHARVERLIEADAGLRAERDFWLMRLSALDESFEQVQPPAHVLGALEKRLFGLEKRTSWWDSLALWRGLTAGALAVAVAAIGFSLVQPAPDAASLTTQLVAALDAEDSDVRFVALYDGSGAMRLTALSGEAVPDRDYELWAIQGGDPISMGVVSVADRNTVMIGPEVMEGWGEGSVLAITLEPEGGAPGGVPTGPVVAQGAVTQI